MTDIKGESFCRKMIAGVLSFFKTADYFDKFVDN